MAADMSGLALRVVSRALFGAELDEDALAISRDVAEVGEFFDYLTIALLPLLLRTPLPRVRRFRAGIDHLQRETARVIAGRRDAPADGNGDLLSILLAARDVEGDGTGMSDEQIRDEAVTLITAGHETTANGLTWTWYLLARHPGGGGAASTPSSPRRWAAARPARTTSPRCATPRRCCSRRCGSTRRRGGSSGGPSCDQEIGGYVIPAGAAVLMPTFVINRDPRLFPDPLRFDPERFLGESAAARPDWAYPLFGAGTRKCIGVGFAMLEAVLVVAELAQRFRLRLDPGRTVVPQARVSLRPRGGLWMRAAAARTRERRRSRRRRARPAGGVMVWVMWAVVAATRLGDLRPPARERLLQRHRDRACARGRRGCSCSSAGRSRSPCWRCSRSPSTGCWRAARGRAPGGLWSPSRPCRGAAVRDHRLARRDPQSNLDAKPANALAAVGVGLAAALTVARSAHVRRRGARLAPPRRPDRARDRGRRRPRGAALDLREPRHLRRRRPRARAAIFMSKKILPEAGPSAPPRRAPGQPRGAGRLAARRDRARPAAGARRRCGRPACGRCSAGTWRCCWHTA